MGENHGNVPVEAITEARHALANEYVTLSIGMESSSFLKKFHRKRIAAKTAKLKEYIAKIDAFLERFKA